jgi:transcriptional regulator with XRE-family HTH domain
VSGVVEKAEYNYTELENLSNNILKKMVSLNITLPDLAKIIGMEYQTLWRIAYKKNNYMPNLRVLFPIANFFGVTVADLLKNPNIPQYIPIINIQDVHKHLLSKLPTSLGKYKKILCNEYVHESAFALEIESNYLERLIPIKYVFKPYSKVIENSYTLFRYDNHYNFLFNIVHISRKNISGINMHNGESCQLRKDAVAPLALAIKQLMDNDLI